MLQVRPRGEILPEWNLKYICTGCSRGRAEEIIGDDSPKCSGCGKPMIRATLSYKGLWMSPSFVIHRMQKIVETHGTREAQSSRRFKQEREAWTTAVWALGLKQMHERDHWVEIETEDNTPDTKVHRLDQSSQHINIETYNIEVVDWEQHVDDPMQVIQQKCVRAYPPYFWLLITGRSGKVLDPSTIIEATRGTRVPFVEIWIVGRALADRNRMQMVRLFPGRADVAFDLNHALQQTEKQAEFMRPMQRGSGTEVRSLGDLYLPIPE
jgi:hypothetical protein